MGGDEGFCIGFQRLVTFSQECIDIDCSVPGYCLPTACPVRGGGFDSQGIPTYDAPAMASPLTQAALPAEPADRNQVIEIKEIIDSFPRLVDIVEADLSTVSVAGRAAKWRQFPVEIKLRFGWADARREAAIVRGTVRARMPARCQRCLEPFDYELESPVNWLLVPPGDVADNGADFELWELDEDRLRPADIVEESLILAMPMAAMHADLKVCSASVPGEPVQNENKVRPFATLKSQMQDLK